MESALLSTESLDTGELADTDTTLTNGLALLQSEMSGLMPGMQIRSDVSTTAATASNSGASLSLEGSLEGAGVMSDTSEFDSSGDLNALLNQDLNLNDAQLSETLAELDTSVVVENQHETVTTHQAAVLNTQGQNTNGQSNKGLSRMRGVESVESTSRQEEITSEREVSMEARDVKSADVADELIEEWDSSHLQLESEFEHVAANSPFSKTHQATVLENRSAVQADALEAADNDGVKETAKADEKKIAEKTIEAQVELEEFEENPADARVELSDQRTVRVVVDEDLSVEVSQDGEAVDVLVEGAQDVTNELRDAAPEIADSLDEAGYNLRDFTTRDERGAESHSTGTEKSESNREAAEDAAQTVVNRGQSVNVVA